MRRVRSLSAWLAVALVCAAILYGLPTLIEMLLLHRLGPISEVAIGDLAGCLVLCVMDWKKGVALYLGLTALELLLLSFHVMRAAQVVWFTDLVPAIVVFGALMTGFKTFASAARMENAPLPPLSPPPERRHQRR